MCGLTNWYSDPRETAQKTPQLGEASPMGISFPKLHVLILVGSANRRLLFQTSSQALSQEVLPSGSLQGRQSLYFCKREKSFLCICLYSPDRVDCLCSMQALHLSMLCIAFVYLLKRPNRKHKNNLFTIWKRNYSRHPLKMVFLLFFFFPTAFLIG